MQLEVSYPVRDASSINGHGIPQSDGRKSERVFRNLRIFVISQKDLILARFPAQN
jgi:hypothetical protein